MSAWSEYLKENTDENGHHLTFKNWSVYGVWTFVRSDDWVTAHKIEAPFCTWRTTIEWSMQLADKYIPLNGDPPEGIDMRCKSDTLYTELYHHDKTVQQTISK